VSGDHSEQSTKPTAEPLRRGFAAAYPPSKRLDGLLRSFWAGDYRTARREAARIAKRAKEPTVRKAAADLLSRLSPSRLELYLYLLPVALLLLLAAHYLFLHH
jgi:hypothetical protein